jgi:hypothetical protein
MDTYVFTTSSDESIVFQGGEKFYKFLGIFFISVKHGRALQAMSLRLLRLTARPEKVMLYS